MRVRRFLSLALIFIVGVILVFFNSGCSNNNSTTENLSKFVIMSNKTNGDYVVYILGTNGCPHCHNMYEVLSSNKKVSVYFIEVNPNYFQGDKSAFNVFMKTAEIVTNGDTNMLGTPVVVMKNVKTGKVAIWLGEIQKSQLNNVINDLENSNIYSGYPEYGVFKPVPEDKVEVLEKIWNETESIAKAQ